MADPQADARVANLRRRWELDRSPSASIPLAEEYRRQRRYAEASTVLESALQGFPQHLSALVALGRVRLESGDAAGAEEALSRVVARDPMQLVANKLLGEAYLALGRPADAERRLRIYALLNDRDPDLPGLQRRLREALAAASAEGAMIHEPAVVAAPAAAAAPPPSGAGAGVDADREPPVFRLGVAPPAESRAPEPFADLWGFALPSAAGGPADAVDPGEPVPFPFLLAAADRARYLGSMRAAALWDEIAGPGPLPSAGPASPPAVETVTLADLYLDQGHFEDARRVYGEVLARDPDNEAARQGLARAELRLLERPGAAAGDRPSTAAAAHAALLRTWLERVRSNATLGLARDHVR